MKTLWISFLLLGVMTVAGCGGKKGFEPIPADSAYPEIPARVVVTDFRDDRILEVQTADATKAYFHLWKNFSFTQPDTRFSAYIENFQTMFARRLAETFQESGQFAEAEYYPATDIPARGTYDVLVQGTINEATMEGQVFYYFLSLPVIGTWSDVPWTFLLPKLRRGFNFDIAVQFYDGYTGDPLLEEPIVATYNTTWKTFTAYGKDEIRYDDLKLKLGGLLNEVLLGMRGTIPPGDDVAYWDGLREEGEAYLARLAREEERMKKGSPPVFQFLSPSADATIRTPEVSLSWSITAPNGLRSAALVLNDQPLSLNLNALDMADEGTAPKSVPARNTPVELAMGRNTFEARVTDHRENVTEASLEIVRMPARVRPEERYALLLASGSEEAASTVEDLASLLTDPYVGQFDDGAVEVAKANAVTMEDLEKRLFDFGIQPKAGELAFVYLALPGDTELKTVGDGIALNALVDTVRRSLATDEVILLLDIDWNAENADLDVLDALGELPLRWAVAVSDIEASPAMTRGGHTLFGEALIGVLEEEPAGSESLSLEGMLESLLERVDDLSGEEKLPEVVGRYDRNIVMVQYE